MDITDKEIEATSIIRGIPKAELVAQNIKNKQNKELMDLFNTGRMLGWQLDDLKQTKDSDAIIRGILHVLCTTMLRVPKKARKEIINITLKRVHQTERDGKLYEKLVNQD